MRPRFGLIRSRVEPVMIMGREVRKASLCSENKMTELGVTEGCLVEVGLSNDVTPKVYRVVGNRSNQSVLNNQNNQNTTTAPAVQGGNSHNFLKVVGSVAAMTIALVVIWQTGLLIPLGLIGLAMSGIIK